VQHGVRCNAKILYADYKYRAKLRKIGLSITFEEFVRITQQDCYLCGAKPANKMRNQRVYDYPFIYNGIDRIDNSKGYHTDNILPCCAMCNSLKSKFSLDEFMLKVASIYRLHAARCDLLSIMKREANGKTPSVEPPKTGNRRRSKL
jgi:hypothetical protein